MSAKEAKARIKINKLLGTAPTGLWGQNLGHKRNVLLWIGDENTLILILPVGENSSNDTAIVDAGCR